MARSGSLGANARREQPSQGRLKEAVGALTGNRRQVRQGSAPIRPAAGCASAGGTSRTLCGGRARHASLVGFPRTRVEAQAAVGQD
jgi:hypothetical protein